MKNVFLALLFVCLNVFAAPANFSPYVYDGDYPYINGLVSTSLTSAPLTQTVISALPSNLNSVTLAFATGYCGSEKWSNGITGSTFATNNVAALVAAGKYYTISAGGAAQTFKCGTGTTPDVLNMTKYVLTYSSLYCNGYDWDFEGYKNVPNGFQGYISGNVLYVTTNPIVPIIKGMVVYGGSSKANTYVTAFIGTSSGGIGQYIVNYSQTVNQQTFNEYVPRYSIDDLNNVIQALVAVQAQYPYLWHSFSVSGSGGNPSYSLDPYGIQILAAINQYGLKNWSFSVQAFDMITDSSHCVLNSAGTACSQVKSFISLVQNMNAYYGVPVNRIEPTLMIGKDDSGNILTLQDVAAISQYANDIGLRGLHMWAFNRDIDCSLSTVANDTCNSYGSAGTLGYTNTFLTYLGY